MPAVEQKRLTAKGRSMLILSTTTSRGIEAASRLKRLSCRSHTGVSRDGVTLMSFVFPAKSARLTLLRFSSSTEKAGARSPALTSGPITVSGFPFMVITPDRSMPFLPSDQNLVFCLPDASPTSAIFRPRRLPKKKIDYTLYFVKNAARGRPNARRGPHGHRHAGPERDRGNPHDKQGLTFGEGHHPLDAPHCGARVPRPAGWGSRVSSQGIGQRRGRQGCPSGHAGKELLQPGGGNPSGGPARKRLAFRRVPSTA